MALVADSGALYALYDRSDRHHRAVRQVVEEEHGAILIPSSLLSEIAYLLRMRLGADAEIAFMSDLLAGSFSLHALTMEDLRRCEQLLLAYRDLNLGLADASVVAVADRYGIARLLTLDERDFRVVRSRRGQAFLLLPADR